LVKSLLKTKNTRVVDFYRVKMVGRAVVALGGGGSELGWRVAGYGSDWRRVGGRNKVRVARSIFWNKKKSGRNIFRLPEAVVVGWGREREGRGRE
jgi:hypothetical protein